MLPNPLHPAIVHFPVVLTLLLPLFAIGAWWAIRRGARMRVAWSLPLAFAAALTLSAWGAVKTGESQGERVERVIGERPLDGHEEMAEAFLASSVVLTVIASLGLVGGLAGKAARVLTVVGAFALVIVAVRVGHSGGQLVYKYGAANAYATPGGGVPSAPAGSDEGLRRRDGDEDPRR